MRMQWLRGLLLVPLALCATARADTTLMFEQSAGPGGTPHQQPIYISNGHIRLDGGLPQSYVLFDAKTQTVTRVDVRSKTYVRIDARTLDAIAAAVKSAQSEALARMKEVPAQQGGHSMAPLPVPGGGGQELPPMREVPTARTMTINSYRCNMVDSYRGAERVAQLCVVKPGELGVSAQDFSTLQAFQAFTRRMESKFPSGAHRLELGDARERHIPVQVTQFEPGGRDLVTQLKKVSHSPLAASRFEVPAGYTRRQVMQPLKGH